MVSHPTIPGEAVLMVINVSDSNDLAAFGILGSPAGIAVASSNACVIPSLPAECWGWFVRR